jgi:hypothetical protein
MMRSWILDAFAPIPEARTRVEYGVVSRLASCTLLKKCAGVLLLETSTSMYPNLVTWKEGLWVVQMQIMW